MRFFLPMPGRSFLIVLVVLAVLGIVSATLLVGLQQPKEIIWMDNVDEALAKAKQENKYVLIYFYGMKFHGYACREMENKFFKNEQVVDFIKKHFICVKFDIEAPGAWIEAADKYYIKAPPSIVLLSQDGVVLARFMGHYYTPENFITASKCAMKLIESPLSLDNALDQTQMLLSFPESATGWVRPDLYLSPVYTIKPGETIKHTIIYEKASPSDWATARLLIRSCEKEGAIKYWVAGEYQGLSFIDEDVARGKTVASCCAMPWTDVPQYENVQQVTSQDYAGKFQFVMIILIEHD